MVAKPLQQDSGPRDTLTSNVMARRQCRWAETKKLNKYKAIEQIKVDYPHCKRIDVLVDGVLEPKGRRQGRYEGVAR
jgi:hypothetical protein